MIVEASIPEVYREELLTLADDRSNACASCSYNGKGCVRSLDRRGVLDSTISSGIKFYYFQWDKRDRYLNECP